MSTDSNNYRQAHGKMPCSLPAFDNTAFWARGGFMWDMADAEHYMLEMESVGKVPTRPAPAVGHDTSVVLQTLGCTVEQIQQMNASGPVLSEML